MLPVNLSVALIQNFELSDSLAEHLASRFQRIAYERGTLIFGQGDSVRKLYFLESGFIRIFFEENGKEITQWISTPGYFLTELRAFYGKKPSRWSMEALSDTVVYTIGKDSLEVLEKEFPDWVKYERNFITKCFETIENRVRGLLSQSAEERYQAFMHFAPNLFNEVPLKHLASMLGMSPETLSRLRAKK